MMSIKAFVAALVFSFIGLSAQGADLIIFGGDIVTVDDKNPNAEAVAVGDGKILFVGEKEQALSLKKENTELVDLKGQTLLPGFISADTHVLLQGLLDGALDVGPMANKTVADVIKVLQEAAKKGPVLAIGYDPTMMTGPDQLNFKTLNAISKIVPILVINKSGHVAYGNVKAFEQAGVVASNVQPPGGTYGIDDEGKLNGTAYEIPAIMTLVRGFSSYNYNEIAKKSVQQYAKNGFTTLTQMGAGLDGIQTLSDVANTANAPVRIQAYLYFNLLPRFEELSQNNNQRFSIRGVTIWQDGSVIGYSASLKDLYLNQFIFGNPYYTLEQLQLNVLEARRNNVQIAVHASGDKAIDDVLTAFENAQRDRPSRDPRFRIEHATLADDGAINRMQAANATPSFTNQILYFWGDALKKNILGNQRTNLIDSARSVKEIGLKFSFNDDAPLATINPLLMMQIGVTRKTAEGTLINPDETVTVDDAIKALTIYPAWQSFRENEIGSIETGKLADFVILDKNPKKVKSEEIGSIKVLGTYLNGQKVKL